MFPDLRRAARPSSPGAALGRAACLAAGLAAVLAGCSSDVNPIKAATIDAGLGPNPVKAAFVDAGYGPKAVETPDFVAKTRREGLDYMPVGVSAPKPAVRARSTESQKSLQAELESARAANEARGRAAEGAAKGTAKGLKPAAVPADPPAAQ